MNPLSNHRPKTVAMTRCSHGLCLQKNAPVPTRPEDLMYTSAPNPPSKRPVRCLDNRCVNTPAAPTRSAQHPKMLPESRRSTRRMRRSASSRTRHQKAPSRRRPCLLSGTPLPPQQAGEARRPVQRPLSACGFSRRQRTLREASPLGEVGTAPSAACCAATASLHIQCTFNAGCAID